MQTTQAKVQEPSGFVRRSCTQCIRCNVCAIIKAITPLMETWKETGEDGKPLPGVKLPFEAVSIAAICTEFLNVSQSLLDTLAGGSTKEAFD